MGLLHCFKTSPSKALTTQGTVYLQHTDQDHPPE